ncbi:MAG: cation:proton antiporter, partial [Candidatus Zixiibacteriota bacterium]
MGILKGTFRPYETASVRQKFFSDAGLCLEDFELRLLTGKRLFLFIAIAAVYVLYGIAFGAAEPEAAGEADEGHGGPVLNVLLQLMIILLAAKLGGDLFERFHQPAVLGELVLGMIIGNLQLVGVDIFEPFKHDITLEVLAEIGVIILLFEVGLESTVKEMMRVGLTSFMVAVFGVVAPFFLGWGVGALFLPDASIYVHIFIGATLTATSVGITARVLRDIGKIDSREGKIILGA